ncbi:MAG: ABC transporter permease [Pirellulales bacterium]
MNQPYARRLLSRLWSKYATVVALLLVCVVFSVLTLKEQPMKPAAAARAMLSEVAAAASGEKSPSIIIVTGTTPDENDLAASLVREAEAREITVLGKSIGTPVDGRRLLEGLPKDIHPSAVCVSVEAFEWKVFGDLATKYPHLADAKLLKPGSVYWPTFFQTENLLNVAGQISVIAILAIGMTVVIITGGIDLSVGSLIALSSVVTAILIRDYAGGKEATTLSMIACSAAGIAVCGCSGLFSGVMITQFRIPSFIVTLAMMLVTSGIAYLLSSGASISDMPAGYVRLGHGADLLGMPNSVVLMLVLYGAAHLVMNNSVFGREVYAVGGNAEAARLSGVSVSLTIIVCYVLSGLLAGLGGIIVASQLKSGSPTYGQMDEMLVIAAVVVGGTSLSGGEGNVMGTLVGALLIAVIKNGMNLTGVESYTQKVVLGLVLLGAAVLDSRRADPN